MINREFSCSYAFVRYQPDRETEEFANVGIVLCCPRSGFLGVRWDEEARHRLAAFFPQFSLSAFRASLELLDTDLKRHCKPVHASPASEEEIRQRVEAFRHLIRPRESMFTFSTARVALSADPVACLDALFDRHFPSHRAASVA